VGVEFWKQLCTEHGLSADGTLEDSSIDGQDNKEMFFYQSDDDHYIPRAILLDTEPGVIKQIQASAHGRLFNNESIFVAGKQKQEKRKKKKKQKSKYSSSR
jgi:tubulin gamma